ncbi:hypothetical protein [Limimaricola sp.]|uniref:hypothetical protein n=1 Tax=Limimaricola sp. TaxID=2211665 RepID=UPI0025C0CCEF|nr:hypothetical protein [Limimaricola sp.]
MPMIHWMLLIAAVLIAAALTAVSAYWFAGTGPLTAWGIPLVLAATLVVRWMTRR